VVTLDGGYSLDSILIGTLLAAAAIAIAFGPELLNGVQRRRRETASLDQSAPAPVVERKSAAL
jgi:hypothetical protein